MIDTIRKALETYLKNTPGLALPIAYENTSFTPPADGSAYVESRLMPADPDARAFGALMYFERGIYQITLCYPEGRGVGDSDQKAKMLRQRFARGVSILRDGIAVNVIDMPALRAGFPANGQWRVPVSVPWQAEVSMQ